MARGRAFCLHVQHFSLHFVELVILPPLDGRQVLAAILAIWGFLEEILDLGDVFTLMLVNVGKPDCSAID